MFEKLEIFRQSFALARYAAARQSVISTNIANADTPGFKAQDLAPFSHSLQHMETLRLRTTRPGHVPVSGRERAGYARIRTGDSASPNGNTVSLESEMVRASETRQQHELALGIYAASLDILRTSLGRK